MRIKTLTPLITIIYIIALAYYSIAIAAIDAPHNESNSVSCGSCHGEGLLQSFWGGSGLYSTINELCLSCHKRPFGPYTDDDAPVVKTHSSDNTSNKYGEWSRECRDCHDPHYQKQKNYKNTDAGILYLATGTITSCTYNGDGTSTLTYSNITYKTGWDATRLLEKTGEYRRTILFPNIGKLGYSYPVVAIDTPLANTITVKGDARPVYQYISSSTFAAMYGQYIKDFIDVSGANKTVKFFDQTGTNSFADGDAAYNGICEVCHTLTDHYRNNGIAPDQNHSNVGGADGTNCISCHKHVDGFAHGSGGGTGCDACHGKDSDNGGVGSTISHSTHTENDTDDLRGPFIPCGDCHDTNNYPYFKSGNDSNEDGNYDLSETDVCDTCHSPGGTYDGVDGPSIGAKNNWPYGVYNGNNLKAGKEKWCALCHDESPGNSKPDGSGVDAPNIIGDEDGTYPYGTGWGYYKTGHGLLGGTYPASEAPAARKVCLDCHDSTKAHIDDNARTYSAASDNYQKGYRLRDVDGGSPMDIPRTDWDGIVASDFALCFECHVADLYIGSTNYTTNFREDLTYNSHEYHLQTGGAYTNRWDSDWDGTTGDSQISCTACHNVHGSPSPRMVRHGELISTPGTTDKVPALYFKYTPETFPFPTLLNSTGGKTGFLTGGGGTIGNTGICSMCHNRMVSYTRTPNDVYPPKITSVYGKAGSNSLEVIFSEGVYTDTGASGDLTIVDFALTDTDNSRTITGVVHTAGDDSATLTLSSDLDTSDDIGTDTLAAATATSIYDASDNPMDTDPVTITSDTDPPAISNLDPAHGAPDVSIAKDLAFTLSDSDSGVDFTTFSIQLSGDKGYSKTYTDTDTVVSKTGSRAEYDVAVAPDANFGTGEVITVTVNVDDVAGNPLISPAWSFTTEATPTPQTIPLHPSDIASNPGGYSTYGGAWPVILDSDDGDTTYAYSGGGAQGQVFSVDTDDPVGLGSTTIQSITFHVYARYVDGFSPVPPPASGTIDIGYKTGTNTVWKGDTSIDGSGNYNVVSSSTYTTDSDGGALDLTDINNLQIFVKRRTSGGCPLRVTEIYVDVIYIPIP